MFTLPVTSRDLFNFGKPPPIFWKFRLGEQTQGFQKLFSGIAFCICGISLQPQPQDGNKKFHKFNFDFGHRKLPELAGLLNYYELPFYVPVLLTL